MPFDWPLERAELIFVCSGPGVSFVASSIAAMALSARGDSRRSSYWLGFALGTSVPLAAALILYGAVQWLERHLEWLVPYLVVIVLVALAPWLIRRTRQLDWLTRLDWRNWTVVPEIAGQGFNIGKHAVLLWWGLAVFPVFWYSVVMWLRHA